MKVSRPRVRCIFTMLSFTAVLCLPISSFAQKPRLAPVNSDFAKYQNDEFNATRAELQDASGHTFGKVPAIRDSSYLKGKHIFGQHLGGTLPSSYDLRDHDKLTSVKDQGSCGSCWAHAAMGSLESYLMPDENWDFSENNLKNLSGFDYGCCGGGTGYMSSAYLLRWNGPVNESDDPYEMSCSSNTYEPQKHVQDIIFIPPRGSFRDNNNLKEAVMTYGAVDVSYYHDDNYYNSAKYAYYCYDGRLTNHEVCLVGWDDTYSKSNFKTEPPGDGAFIIKNSWGSSWGDNGYFYISYYDTNFATSDESFVYKAEDTDNYAVIYQYDPLGWVTSLGYGGENTAWFANVFTASNDYPIRAVGWYTAEPNSPYEIYVYKDPTSGPINPSSYVAHKAGTISNTGYTTIRLDSPVSLAKDQKFSVVVKLTTSNYSYPVPIEYAMDGYSSGAVANPGESYVSPSGNSWEDLWYEFPDYGVNVCLKAYAGSEATIPPELQINSPTTESTYCTLLTAIDVCGVASDNRSVSSVTWENTTAGTGTQSCEDGGSWATWCARDVPIQSEASNNIVFTATDSDGNQTQASLTVINDSVSPTVSITSPTSEDNYYPEVSAIGIAGTAADNLSVASVTWSNSGTGASGTCTCSGTKNVNWSASGIVLADGDGTNVITVTATDLIGHTSTDTLTVTHYPALKEIQVFPSRVGLVQGMSQKFKAIPIDIDGNVRPLPGGSSSIWAATTGEISAQTGEFTAGSASSVVTVTVGSMTAQSDVEVFPETETGGYVLERWWGGNLEKPVGVAVGLDGSVYLADSLNNRIQKYSSTGYYDDSFTGVASDSFDTPRGIAIDSAGNFYISDTRNNRIQKYNSDWEFMTEWGSYGTGNGQFISPHGIAVDGSDNIYVADSGNNRIQKFDANGSYLAQLSSSTATGADFSWPRDVAFVETDGNRYLYVLDTLNNRVVEFNETAANSHIAALSAGPKKFRLGVTNAASTQSVSYTKVTSWGTVGTGEGEFMNPDGITVGVAGDVFVSDYLNNRVQEFDSTGKFLYKWGEHGTSGGQFAQPAGIRQDSDGNIYIVDMNNDRVQKYVPAGYTSITITGPSDDFDGFWHDSNISVSGVTTGIVACVTWANSTTGEGGTCMGTRTWSADDIPLTSGRNVIVITAQGSTGDEAQATLIVYYTPEDHALVVSTPSLNPSTVESGATTAISASAVDSQGHDVIYTWSDGGAGGSFENAHAASTAYTAPVNTTNDNLVVLITCQAVCQVNSEVSGSASAQLIVIGSHKVTMTKNPTLDPSTVSAGSTTSCSVEAVDSRDDDLIYNWSDSGAGGTFSPSASVQNPTYTAPDNTTGSDKSVTLICAAACSQTATIKAVGTVILTVTDPPPTIAITGPTSDATTTRTGSTVNLSGTASGDVTQITWVNGATGESGSIAGAADWKIEGIGLEAGTNIIALTASDAGNKTASDVLQITRITTSVADVWKGLMMVSLPIIPDETDPKTEVDFFNTSWMIYKTLNGTYIKYDADTNHYTWFEPTSATPGRGFWAVFGTTVEDPHGMVPDQTQSTADTPNVVSIHLYKGWNIIGQPFLKAVDWDTTAIEIKTLAGVSTPLKDAGKYVVNYAWGWQQNSTDIYSGDYYLIGDPDVIAGATGQLAPWRAYWIRALQECYLVIPAP